MIYSSVTPNPDAASRFAFLAKQPEAVGQEWRARKFAETYYEIGIAAALLRQTASPSTNSEAAVAPTASAAVVPRVHAPPTAATPPAVASFVHVNVFATTSVPKTKPIADAGAGLDAAVAKMVADRTPRHSAARSQDQCTGIEATSAALAQYRAEAAACG